jgi:hypothetical protein
MWSKGGGHPCRAAHTVRRRLRVPHVRPHSINRSEAGVCTPLEVSCNPLSCTQTFRMAPSSASSHPASQHQLLLEGVGPSSCVSLSDNSRAPRCMHTTIVFKQSVKLRCQKDSASPGQMLSSLMQRDLSPPYKISVKDPNCSPHTLSQL